MRKNAGYVMGDWKAVCDRCGADFLASQLKKEWTGLMCCSRCWEPRHPQDFVRGVKDMQAPPWTRPDQGATYATFCSIPDRAAVPGIGIPGCMTPGFVPKDLAAYLPTYQV